MKKQIKPQKSEHQRPVIYWTFIFAALLSGGPILNMQGVIPKTVNSSIEAVGIVLLTIAVLFVFKAYKRTKSAVLGIVAIAFVGTLVLEIFHALSYSPLIANWRLSTPEVFMTWTWNLSQLFLSSMLLIAALLSNKDAYGTTSATVVQKNTLTGLAVFSAIAIPVSIFLMLGADLKTIYTEGSSINRPPDLVSGSLFAIAALVFGIKGNWRRDSYGHWIIIALIAGLSAQLFFMAFARESFDSSFTAAHLLKIGIYAVILYGFARSQDIVTAASEASNTNPTGLGMGAKLAILCGLVALIAVMPLAIKSNKTLHLITTENSIRNLSNAAEMTGQKIIEQRLRVDSDLRYLANVTTSEALNSLTNSGISNDLRKLSSLSRNLLLSDPEYFSVTYIDAVSGETLFRNEQVFNSNISSAAQLALAESTNELFDKALISGPEQPINRSKIIPIQDSSLEEGRLQIEGTALTIYANNSTAPEGVFILHSNVSRELTSANVAEYPTTLYVVDSSGRFITHKDIEKEIGQGRESEYTIADEFPELDFIALMSDRPSGASAYKNATGVEVIVGANRLSAANGAGEDLLYIYTALRADVERNAKIIGNEMQQTGQLAMIFAIILGWLLARLLARPVKEISAAAVQFGHNGEIREMPIDGHDEIGMLAKSLHDMMTQVNAQRDKLSLLAAAVESSVDSIIITDDKSRIIYANPQYEKYAGINGESIIGKFSNELVEFKDHMNILSETPSVKSGEAVWTGQYVWRRADGELHDESLTISPIRDKNGEIINYSMIIEDITKRRQMEKNIEAQAGELLRSNKDLEQFAYVASHDLKAPLRAIEVILEWLHEDLEGYNEGDVQENLTLLGQRTSRLGRLLEDLLAYSRAGRKVGDVRRLNMQAFVEDIATLVAPTEGPKIIADQSLPELQAHHAPLETVLRNLINNAIKHHPDPEHGTIKVYAKDQGESIVFSVEDDGDGIPEEYATKVFKMFQTLKPRDDCEGSGMGLAIVQRIITWQGGTIWFENNANGKGIVFNFVWNKSLQDMPEIKNKENNAATRMMEIPLAS